MNFGRKGKGEEAGFQISIYDLRSTIYDFLKCKMAI